MADITREPWNDPAKNSIAAQPSRMNGRAVQATLLVGPDGEPYASSGGSLTVDIQNKGATSSVTSVAASAASVSLLAANADRVESVIYNDSTEVLYVKYGATASTSSFTVKLQPDEAVVVTGYTGAIDGIWSAAVGNARITEVTP